MSKENEIYLSRNKNKKQKIIYLYEAEINMLQEIAKKTTGRKSVSKIIHSIIAKTLINNNKQMNFLKNKDINEINELDKYITYNK
jgi:hypothetical protein